MQEVPSEEAQKKLRIPNITITCASPLCPNFDNLIEAKSIVVAIEPEKNLAMSYVPLKPIAGLDEIHDSPIDGSKNWRGRGEHNVLWFHLTCLEALSTKQHDCPEPGPSEFPTMSQPLAAMSRCIQPESRPFVAGTKYTHLGSPRVQTLYKWQGVVQLEKALAFQDGNEGFYINDDMDAAYLVEKHSKLKGTVGRIPVEITGAQARGQLLSTLLRYIDGRKIEASKKKGESTSNHDYVKSAMTVDRRVENLGRLGGEIGTMKEFEEQVSDTLSYAALY